MMDRRRRFSSAVVILCHRQTAKFTLGESEAKSVHHIFPLIFFI